MRPEPSDDTIGNTVCEWHHREAHKTFKSNEMIIIDQKKTNKYKLETFKGHKIVSVSRLVKFKVDFASTFGH